MGRSEMNIKKIARKNIVIINNPSDGKRWADIISETFISELFQTHIDFSRSIIGWSFDEDIEKIVESTARLNPDIILLPDDRVYKKFAKVLSNKTKALILFTSFHLDIKDFNDVPQNRQAGVYSDHPINHLLKQANRIKKIKKIGLVSGPLGKDIAKRIKSSLEGEIEVDIVITDEFETYRQTSVKFSKDCDAVFPLAPIGIKDSGGNWVSIEQMAALIQEINSLTLGYGNVKGVSRTVEINIDPATLGKNAALIAYKYFLGENVGIEKMTNYGLKIDFPSIQRLNLKVPNDLEKFIKK